MSDADVESDEDGSCSPSSDSENGSGKRLKDLTIVWCRAGSQAMLWILDHEAVYKARVIAKKSGAKLMTM